MELNTIAVKWVHWETFGMFPVMNGLQNSFSKSKIHTILSVGVLLYRPAFLLKVLPWKNVSRVFCDRCNFKKGADFSVKAW